MEWLEGNFLTRLSARAPVAVASEDAGTAGGENRANSDRGGKRLSDAELRDSALAETFINIEWACNPSCTYSRNCTHSPGFIQFALQLRDEFWGKLHQTPPTSSERASKINELLKKYHRYTHQNVVINLIVTFQQGEVEVLFSNIQQRGPVVHW